MSFRTSRARKAVHAALAFGFAVGSSLATLPISDPAQAARTEGPIHVGHATKVVRDVRGQLTDLGERKLVTEDKVFFNENIITAEESNVVIQFRDGSVLELGKNGALIIDDIVFNPFESKSEKAMRLLQGSFRYVSAYVAKDHKVEISTPTGTIGIRGSVVNGFSYPGVPTFVQFSNGQGSFSNGAGSTALGAGDAIASPNNSTPPMSPGQLPAAVAAQAMQHVQETVGASSSTASVVTLSAEAKADNAAANTLSSDEQAAEAGGPAAAAVTPTVTAVTPDIPLLTGAATAGLLTADAPATPTPAQQAFIAEANAQIPDAAQQIQAIVQTEQAQNQANTQAGTAEVVAAVTENAESVEQVQALVEATVEANPDVVEVATETVVVAAATNESVGAEEAAQAAVQGAVTGAAESGADVAAVTQAATEGAVTGAAASGADVTAVTQSATQGAVSGAAAAGADVGAVTQAATQGAVVGAAEAGADVGAVTQAATQGAVTGATEAGADVGSVSEAATVGAVTGATEAGADAGAVTAAVLQGVQGSLETAAGPATAPAAGPPPPPPPPPAAPVTETIINTVENPGQQASPSG